MKVCGYEVHQAATEWPLLSDEELAALTADIKAHGLKIPILLYEGTVLDGRNRLLACKAAGVDPKFKDVNPRESPYLGSISLNGQRRDVEKFAKVGIVKRLLAKDEQWQAKHAPVAVKEAADAKRSEKAKARPRKPDGTLAASRGSCDPQLDAPRADDGHAHRRAVAEACGVSTGTVARYEALEKAAPDLARAVTEKKTTASKAMGEAKQRAKAAVAEQIRAAPAPTPRGPFPVIAIDPPWKYDNRVEDATHRGRNQYPDMTQGQIAALPVPTLAAEDCVLWLWTTNAFMDDALALVAEWGFTQKTILTWDKQKLGLGDWLRNVTEHCILAVRGKPVVTLTNQTTLISEARREHSRKPEAFYSLVESLCPAPEGGRLEMFAREPRKGWIAWGAETEKFHG